MNRCSYTRCWFDGAFRALPSCLSQGLFQLVMMSWTLSLMSRSFTYRFDCICLQGVCFHRSGFLLDWMIICLILLSLSFDLRRIGTHDICMIWKKKDASCLTPLEKVARPSDRKNNVGMSWASSNTVRNQACMCVCVVCVCVWPTNRGRSRTPTLWVPAWLWYLK